MNKVINKFLLTGEKFKSELYLKNQDLLIVLVDRSLNIIKELKKLEKQTTYNIYIEIN